MLRARPVSAHIRLGTLGRPARRCRGYPGFFWLTYFLRCAKVREPREAPDRNNASNVSRRGRLAAQLVNRLVARLAVALDAGQGQEVRRLLNSAAPMARWNSSDAESGWTATTVILAASSSM